jgi:hypothetical protein
MLDAKMKRWRRGGVLGEIQEGMSIEACLIVIGGVDWFTCNIVFPGLAK